MNITHEQRIKLLKAHNDLKNIMTNIYECQDIWMSDVGKLERIQCDLHNIFKFTPKRDENGERMFYADWVLEDLSVDPEGEQPYV